MRSNWTGWFCFIISSIIVIFFKTFIFPNEFLGIKFLIQSFLTLSVSGIFMSAIYVFALAIFFVFNVVIVKFIKYMFWDNMGTVFKDIVKRGYEHNDELKFLLGSVVILIPMDLIVLSHLF